MVPSEPVRRTYSRSVRILVLFTRDLRVHDHLPLFEASRVASEIVSFFVLDPALLGASPNRDRFLLECLADLDRSLLRLGGRLIVRRGAVVEQTMAIATQTRCAKVFVAGDVSAYARRREHELREACALAGIDLHVFQGSAVIHPEGLARRVMPRIACSPRTSAPGRSERGRASCPYRRSSSSANWSRGRDLIPDRSPPRRSTSHAAASARGGAGCTRSWGASAGYADDRDDLAAGATSRLSPYLRFGCVSANEVATRASELRGGKAFVRQLAWRDFFQQLPAEDPAIAWWNLRDPIGVIDPPVAPDLALDAWREGCTGLIDAGMRQLRREGWMHNRARLVTASFLMRRLGLPWRAGERHFSRLLIDADPANNAGGDGWPAPAPIAVEHDP